ncbi:MAG: hypothetical protein MRECE_31c012 [Mycoplasmataceae bacterium CE_OT135]|nr:MAG: hypothetical protein MRECE_31c012 [Mycoplasmataceae bacterium CE_OT135]
MTDAQNWLNSVIPINRRRDIQELHIFRNGIQNDEDHEITYRDAENKYYFSLENSLTGNLDLSTFPYLEKLTIEEQFITDLNLTNCERLKTIQVTKNYLREIIWPIQAPQLRCVNLNDNNLSARDLSCFANFPGIVSLYLGTDKENRINYNIYNRWNGSLSHLNHLRDLEELDINATDINEGLLYLPTDCLHHFTFGNCGRTNAGVDRFKIFLRRDVELREGETMEDWARMDIYTTDENGNLLDENAHKIEIIEQWQQRIGRELQQQRLQAQLQVPLRQ